MPVQPPLLYSNIDDAYMARCISLAELGVGTVSPNPLVGAIVLDSQGRKVGEGYHHKAGEPHAEVIALEQAGEKARGGTLYVNLEPCNHHGRTPPCTQRIIDAGIQRVVCGTLDPNPMVSGGGRDMLQNSRISVRYGYLEKECKKLNEIFFHYITTRMPFVTVKLGLTLDGKIANRHGESQWLTGSFSRQYVHHLRQQYDAILTTADTIIADNPRLNVRDIPNIRKQPKKIILDRRFRLNIDKYQVFKGDTPVWVVTSALSHNYANAQRAKTHGIKVIEVEEIAGKLNLKALLTRLGEEEITSLFVESGGKLTASLINEQLAQKFFLFYAPKILQDGMSKSAFGQAFQLELPDKPQLEVVQTRQLDQDWVMEARPYKAQRREKAVASASPVVAASGASRNTASQNGSGRSAAGTNPVAAEDAPSPKTVSNTRLKKIKEKEADAIVPVEPAVPPPFAVESISSVSEKRPKKAKKKLIIADDAVADLPMETLLPEPEPIVAGVPEDIEPVDIPEIRPEVLPPESRVMDDDDLDDEEEEEDVRPKPKAVAPKTLKASAKR